MNLDAAALNLLDTLKTLKETHERAATAPFGDLRADAEIISLLGRRDAAVKTLGWAAFQAWLETHTPKPDALPEVAQAPVVAPPTAPPVPTSPPITSPPAGTVILPRRVTLTPLRLDAETPTPIRDAYRRPFEPISAEEHQLLQEALKRIPLPVSPTDSHLQEQLGGLVEDLLDVVRENNWLDLPTEIQRGLVGLCASLAQHAQERDDGRFSEDLFNVFSTLTTFSRENRPGFVFGLSRSHEPMTTWEEEASMWRAKLSLVTIKKEVAAPLNPEKALRALAKNVPEGDAQSILHQARVALDAGVAATDPRIVKLLRPVADVLDGDPRFRALRKAIRDTEPKLEEAENVAPPWPHLHLTEGKSVILVGGDPRTEVLDRVKSEFGFKSVEWVSCNLRGIQTYASRVRSGSVSIVILLIEFVSHAVQELLAPACKDAGAPLIFVPRGYGRAAIRAALESMLVPKA